MSAVRRVGVATGVAAASLVLSGCVAALPVAAAAGIGATATMEQDSAAADNRGKKAKRKKSRAASQREVRAALPAGAVLTNLSALPAPTSDGPQPTRPSVAVPQGGTTVVPPEMQYLYGSGEAAAQSVQTYRSLWNYIRLEIGYRRDKSQVDSVVLSPGSTLASPRFDKCGARPMAVVLDVDETVLLNLGYEAHASRYGLPYDEARWVRWEETGAEKVLAIPGAAETLAALRRDGYTVIFNTNRSMRTAAQTIDAIARAGLGNAVLGETLFLRDDGGPSAKDPRRAKISEKYCVVAMVGDQLGDFSDLFNQAELSVPARRNISTESQLATLWGAGWFMLPNPVYGSALKGALDDVFPKDKQWADPAEESK